MKTLKTLGIIVWYGYGGSEKYGWWAKADLDDFRHCEPGAMTGRIATKYTATMGDAIRNVLATLETLGVELAQNDEIGIPCNSILNDRNVEMAAFWIMQILAKNGNIWRLLPRDEYKRERTDDEFSPVWSGVTDDAAT